MQTVNIDLGQRSYPIHIDSGLLDQRDLIARHVRNRAMVVTNETIAPLYLDQTMASLGNTPSASVILPDGEAYKNLDELNRIFTALLAENFDRGCTLIALGGGVVGDMTGYAAASYQRGVDFIQIPTTLLAQVDSSVGGKTGVNHALGKNMQATAYAVKRSCEIKAYVVEQDEREHGIRALLNLGHTFGHAIEAASGYGQLLHGEAVSAGICMALDTSLRLRLIDEATRVRGVKLLERCALPTAPPDTMTPELFMKYMARDKKVSDGEVRLILLDAIGKSHVSADFDHNALHATLDHFTSGKT